MRTIGLITVLLLIAISTVYSQTINLVDAAKFFQKQQHQNEAWNWLQTQIPADTLNTFSTKYRNGETFPYAFTMLNVATYFKALPHQTEALNYLQGQLPAAVISQFANKYRTLLPGETTAPNAPVSSGNGQMLVTAAQAQAVFLRTVDLNLLDDLNNCLRTFSINTVPRIRHFLAQIGEESGGLRWLTELASGAEYEGRRDLGNVYPGDGVKYKGAGVIQLTGRANYQAFANYMHDPNIMQGANYVASKYPFTSAGFWWYRNNMNSLVDSGASVSQVSTRVNGKSPANGLSERIAYYNRAVNAIH